MRMISRKHDSLKLVLLMYEENARKIGALLSAILPIKDQLAQCALVGVRPTVRLGRKR